MSPSRTVTPNEGGRALTGASGRRGATRSRRRSRRPPTSAASARPTRRPSGRCERTLRGRARLARGATLAPGPCSGRGGGGTPSPPRTPSRRRSPSCAGDAKSGGPCPRGGSRGPPRVALEGSVEGTL